MGLAVVHTRALSGIEAIPVEVEVLTSNGLPGISIVGLPEAAVRESKDRVRGAIKSSGFQLPQQRITINLAPADLPKEGGRYDLPIAIGVLVASGQLVVEDLSGYEFVGELALSGRLRPIKGALPVSLASKVSKRILFVPKENIQEAALVLDAKVLGAETLLEVSAHLQGIAPLKPTVFDGDKKISQSWSACFSEVKGQEKAKRALEIAAAGGHNILLLGPPGTGKTMLASRLAGVLPPMTEAEAIETAAIYSISGQGYDHKQWKQRPIRTPHHSASAVSLVGGGSSPKPGEISLAHNGVLFLDELPEFDRKVLEALREPMESGKIHISRAAQSVIFAARYLFVASMNPCPCGFLGDSSGKCHCNPDAISRYRNKISGPLLDRIDMHVEVPRVPIETLQNKTVTGKTSAQIRTEVIQARKIQYARSGVANFALTGKALEKVCALGKEEQSLLQTAMERLNLSARAYHRILRLARTIADLAGEVDVNKTHLAEAIAYRVLDRG